MQVPKQSLSATHSFRVMLWQVGRAATINIKTRHYLRNGWNSITKFVVDIGHHSTTSFRIRNTTAAKIQHGGVHHLLFLVVKAYLQNGVRFQVCNTLFNVKCRKDGDLIDIRGLYVPIIPTLGAWVCILKPNWLKYYILHYFQAVGLNQIVTKFYVQIRVTKQSFWVVPNFHICCGRLEELLP